MTTKTNPAVLSTDLLPAVEAVAVAAPAVQSRPFSIMLTGTSIPTLHRVAVAVRLGYVPVDIQLFGHTGQISLTLELGNPDPAFAEEVHAEMADAVERERHQNEKAIEEAAIRLVAEREKAARQAEIAAAIAEQEKALRALKRQQVAAA